MQDFEKLGVFYLGKTLDPATAEAREELLLYDSNDLTTHAAIIGMTGSGKTGLGIALIEEAALDHLPVLAVDPKGDLGNLLLTFPELSAEQFEPWVDARVAASQGLSRTDYAAAQAAEWRAGLAEWGQTPERIQRLRAHADFVVYTPGSSAGAPLAVLGHFSPPAAAVREDRELYSGLIAGTATGLLSLLDMNADPVTSKAHILLSTILQHHWDRDAGLDLAGLIGAVQNPPCRTIGVMDIDSFLPPQERFELAMRINNLLAAPGFAAWMEGEAFAIDRLLYSPSGKPQVAVLSIAHLNDRERMFFVTMLLHAVLAWMRRQSGSPSLRALLYIDELFGYMPPVANPPSKEPLLTLLKQARAFGLGLVLSTQNPVDLDYKGLSNIGSWFIGRLQTERDRQRLVAGLKSAATGSIDLQQLDSLLAGLGKRCFLLNNVHEKAPVLFTTRWVMSYLAGPLSRDQLRQLAPEAHKPAAVTPPAAAQLSGTPAGGSLMPPVVEPGIRQTWLPTDHPPQTGELLLYSPTLLAQVTLHYSNARLGVHCHANLNLLTEMLADQQTPEWSQGTEQPPALQRATAPAPAARFAALPSALANSKYHRKWEKQLHSWLRTNRPLRLWQSAELKLTSQPGESERDFRIRLQQAGNERRDLQIAKLRNRYAQRIATLEGRLQRAERTYEREAEQATSSKVDAALSVGTALLGALLGRKRVSGTTLSRTSTAARRAGNARKQANDVQRANATVSQIEAELAALREEFEVAAAEVANAYDAQQDPLTEILIKATAANVAVDWFGIAWRAEILAEPATPPTAAH